MVFTTKVDLGSTLEVSSDTQCVYGSVLEVKFKLRRGYPEGFFSPLLWAVLVNDLMAILSLCEREAMFINPHKVVIEPFPSIRKLDNLAPPSINGITIPFVSEVKYFGITLEKKHNWNSYLEQTIREACLSLSSCGKSFGMLPKQIYWLFVTLTLAMLTYRSILW